MVTQHPARPTGKRSRRGAVADDAETSTGAKEAVALEDVGKGKKRTKKAAKGQRRNPIAYVINYLREVFGELRNVIWPNRKQMVTYTAVVLFFLAFMVALIGLVDLGVARVVMLVFGLRIPLRPFFLVSSVLLYYLAFKFIGTGIHALQVSGVLSATPAIVPSWEPIGLFPTWETTLPQVALLVLAGGVLVFSRLRTSARTLAAQNV